jgi:hypothetical protein
VPGRHFVARSSRASIRVLVTSAAAAGDSLRVLYAALNVGRRNVLGVGVAVNEVFLCQRHCAELLSDVVASLPVFPRVNACSFDRKGGSCARQDR